MFITIKVLYICNVKQKQATMLYTEKIQKLKAKLSTVRSNNEYNKIEKQILKLAKQYNEKNYRDMYLIIDNQVYGLQWRENHLL